MANDGNYLDLRTVVWVLAAWGVAAYLIAPRLWKAYFRRHFNYDKVVRVGVTSDGHPGDPVNIALNGTEEEVVRAMTAAGWFPADPITLRTSVRIAVDSLFRRPDEDAPVSNLFLFGRKQDLAFEQPVDGGPRTRHHVRFWRWDQQRNELPVWFGTATRFGEVYIRYPKGLVPTDFALYVGADGVEVDSDGFTAANSPQYEAAMKAILPEAIRLTTSNNMREME
ncbi:MAG: LssY C-terminal domain-containing protein [Casimicrobiaceae bacterium]